MPVPPKTAQDKARRALAIRKELPKSKRAGTPVGVARANQLANADNLSLDTIKRIKSFIARHEPNYRRAVAQGKSMTDGGVILAMALWGYPGIKSWVDEQINKLSK
mgnify:FL=1|tara:strand:- start:5200 stop:5517 length:318 start_codon:yes stop_codon:yes gene_type:complete